MRCSDVLQSAQQTSTHTRKGDLKGVLQKRPLQREHDARNGMPPPPPGLLVLGATAMQCPQRQSSETNRAAHSPQTEVEQPGALHCVRQPGHPDAAHRVQAPLPHRRQCSRLHFPHTVRAAKHVLQYCESVDHGAEHPGAPRRSNRLARRAIMRTAGGSKPAPGCSSCCSLSPSTLK